MKYRKLRIASSILGFIGLSLMPFVIPGRVITSGPNHILTELDPRFAWPLLTLFTAMVLAPWFPYRVSLRDLFIVTTLVALVLGFIFYAMRG